ncbi:MAG TPA: FkbM family methyltransferase [Candidatus Binataceae bacterium]|nr:FkbM family methyltransferase [Candidatus Binataceae bacterium]
MNRFKTGTITILSGLLPDRVKRSLFHLSFHLANAEFEKFAHDFAFAPSMELGLRAMAARGFAPQTIVDVGAFEGDWSRLAKRVWPAASLRMVEPNLEKQARLGAVAKDLDAALLCELLGADDGQQVQFHLMESGSSIMSERSPLPRTVEQRELRRLDSLFPELARPGLLKIDAQGYELEILKGAGAILPAFEAILVEIAIIEINVGAPLLHDVVAFMKSLGFIAYDILEIHRRPLDQALNQIDLIFVREQSSLVADKRHFA